VTESVDVQFYVAPSGRVVPWADHLRALRIQHKLLSTLTTGHRRLRLRIACPDRPVSFLYWPVQLGTGLDMARLARKAGLVTWESPA